MIAKILLEDIEYYYLRLRVSDAFKDQLEWSWFLAFVALLHWGLETPFRN